MGHTFQSVSWKTKTKMSNNIKQKNFNKLIHSLNGEIVRLVNAKLHGQLDNDCELMRNLIMIDDHGDANEKVTDKESNRFSESKSNTILHESFFDLNASIENFIIKQIECPDNCDDPIGGDISPSQIIHEKCDTILDWCWQAMNCGVWSAVPLQTRRIYAYHRLLQAILTLIRFQETHNNNNDNNNNNNNNNNRNVLSRSPLPNLIDALQSIDYGLIMSPDLGDRLLSTIATEIHRNIISLLDQNDDDSGGEAIDEYRRKWLDVRKKITKLHQNAIKSNIVVRYYRKKSQDGRMCSAVRRVAQIDLPEFERDHLRRSLPIIVTSATADWPSLHCSERRWTLEYLLRRIGWRTAPIEIGAKYTEQSWSQRLLRIIDFIEQYILSGQTEIGYLAQHNLFEQIPELAEDFFIPDLCACVDDEKKLDDDLDDDHSVAVDINAWFGPAGTVSPLHTDPKHNLFAQVLGRKYIRLYSAQTPPEQIYAHDSCRLLSNTSAVDVENPDLDRFPAFDRIDSSLTYECVLEPGELLFIPKRWWHFVKSLDTSFSLSFWWQ